MSDVPLSRTASQISGSDLGFICSLSFSFMSKSCVVAIVSLVMLTYFVY